MVGRKKRPNEKLNAVRDFVPTQDTQPSAERKIIKPKKEQSAEEAKKRKISDNNIESLKKIHHMKVENWIYLLQNYSILAIITKQNAGNSEKKGGLIDIQINDGTTEV